MFSSKLVLCVIFINAARANFFGIYPNVLKKEIVGDPGNRLILTPLIKNGKIAEAKSAALVQFGDFKTVKSFSDFLTVNEYYNSNLFFWFFPSENDYANDPVLLWLQGGPGVSSLLALFTENGPFIVDKNNNVLFREYSWTKNHSVIYIDNPAGVGYSFTNDGGYSENQTQIGKELYEGLQQFFHLFPELQQNEFYITGESYAGKYVPAIGYEILQRNTVEDFKINLKGMAIGNGWSDPVNHMVYSKFLYQIGMIGLNERNALSSLEQDVVRAIQSESWEEATTLWREITTVIEIYNGNQNIYNYCTVGETIVDNSFGDFIQRSDVRRALHVGDAEYVFLSKMVYKRLYEDIFKSVAPLISELLSHYRMLIYNGQLDIIVAYPLTLNYLQNLDFSSADEYAKAERSLLLVNDDVAGYVKKAGNLTEVLVRNSGHMVPTDQPEWGYALISSFVRNNL